MTAPSLSLQPVDYTSVTAAQNPQDCYQLRICLMNHASKTVRISPNETVLDLRRLISSWVPESPFNQWAIYDYTKGQKPVVNQIRLADDKQISECALPRIVDAYMSKRPFNGLLLYMSPNHPMYGKD